MATLKIIKSGSRRGQKLLDRLRRRGEGILDGKVVERTARIVDSIRDGGDRALLKAVRKYDGVKLSSVAELRLTLPDRADLDTLPPGFEAGLERAIASVEHYHRHQVRPGFELDDGGVRLTERRTPLRRVGIYVPGGRAAYPSTVVMTAIPARLAGVEEIVVATPPATWRQSPAIRRTLERLELEEVWGMGGAHAIAALAYGTESLERVDKVVGPGNAWVTAAKHLVSTRVAVDGLAGPSEVVIVATREADPAKVAADLLAQAEHDPLALPLLVTDHARLAKHVEREIRGQLPELATAAVAAAALGEQGAALVVHDMEEALQVVNEVAPEHLQLVGPAAEALVERVTTAAAIFVGETTPEVFGDYVAGPSHVLPTAGTARFASALGVEDFVRRSHVVQFDKTAAGRWAAAAAAIADVEGLPAHAAAARRRLETE